MADLILALAFTGTLALLCALAGAMLARKARRQVLLVVVCAVVLAAVAYLNLVQGRMWVARYVPLSSAIVLTNLVPLAVGFLAGLMSQLTTIERKRRRAFGVLVGTVTLVTWLHPVLAPTPPTSDEWSDGVCLQTTLATCSPAAAATLLRQWNIQTNEAEMARLCLTRGDGTPPLGLYRGLKLMTADTDLVIETTPDSVDQLIADNRWPAIISTMLPDDPDLDLRYQQDWGWDPGVVHSVVVLGVEGDHVEMGDPSVGREFWHVQALRDLYTGDGIRLVDTP